MTIDSFNSPKWLATSAFGMLLQRHLREIKIGCGTVAAISAVLILCWLTADPEYHFDLGQVADPADVRTLLDTSEEVRRLGGWQPRWVSGESAKVLAELIRLPENDSAQRLADLLRLDISSASDPELRGKITALNATIQILTPRIDQERFKFLRTRSHSALQIELQAELDALFAEQRLKALHSAFDRPPLQDFFARHRLCRPPANPGFLRGLACNLMQKENRDFEIWLEAFAAAVKLEIEPVDDWYGRVAAANRLSWCEDPKSGLLLMRTASGPSYESIQYARFDSRADYRLMKREDDSDSSHIAMDTGIRIVQTPLVERSGNRKQEVGTQEPAQPTDQRLRLSWPPGSVAVDVDQFSRFLKREGLARGFGVRNVTPDAMETSARPAVTVQFQLFNREIPDCSWNEELLIDSHGMASLQTQLESIKGESCVRRLREALPGIEEYAGLPVRFRLQSADSPTLHCEFQPPGMRPICLPVGVSAEGELVWQGLPTLSDCAAIAERICGQIDDLDGLEPIVTITAIEIKRNGLGGRLAIHGSLLDGRDVKGLQWRLSPDGLVQVELSRETAKLLTALHGQTTGVPARVVGEAAKISQRISEHVASAYPSLRGQVEVDASSVPNGTALRLGLRIADWPPVILGPVLIMGEDKAFAAVDELLAEETVRSASVAQWKQVSSHPRFGRIRGELVRWSSTLARGRIDCRVDLGSTGVVLPFVEEVRCQSREWTTLTGRQLCSMLEPIRIEIEDGLGRAMGELTQGRIQFSIDRDTFGPGRWIRLNPLTVACTMRFRPHDMPIEVAVRRVLVDTGGVHWPDRFSAAWLGTFDMPPLSPWCAISDPELTIDFKERGLWVGCKITPPRPPLPPVSLDPTSRVRTDNPWLHAIFLEGRLGGNLQYQELTADAEVRLFERHSAAHAQLTCDFASKVIRAEVHARPVPIGLAPELSGELSLTGIGELEVNGTTRLAGCTIEGRLQFRATSDIPEATILGTTNLPFVGGVDVRGGSDVFFREPWVASTGKLALPFGNCPLRFDFQADRQGYQLTYFAETTSGPASYALTGPSLDLVDEDALRDGMRTMLTALEKSRRPTEKEVECIGRLEPVPNLADRDDGPEPEEVDEPQSPNWKRPQLIVDLKADIRDDKAIRFYSRSKPDTDLLVLPRSEAREPSQCRFMLWTWPDSARCDLLVVDGPAERVIRVHAQDANTRLEIDDLTDTFAALEPRFPVGGERNRLSSPAKRSWKAMEKYVAFYLNGQAPQAPAKLGEGYVIRHDALVSDKSHASFVWNCAGHAHWIQLFPGIDPANVPVKVCNRLARLTPRRNGGYLVAVDSEKAQQLALLTRTKALRAGKGEFELTLYEGDSDGAGILPFAVELVSMDVESALPLATRFAQAVWGGLSDLPNATIYLGPEGICTTADEDGFWLGALYAAEREPWRAHLRYLPRARFNGWEQDTNRFLPQKFDTASARQQAQRAEIARWAVQSWNQNRQDSGANPIGLLIGLADE